MKNKTIKAMFRLAFFCSLIAAVFAMNGCTVSTSHRDGHDDGGKGKDVDIRTPFGSLSVREGSMDPKDTGLSPYPGAQLKKSADHDGDSSANVNISSSIFGMKLAVLKYLTKDSPDKVAGFYRKDLSRYGKVVDCQGNFSMTFHPREKNDNDVSCNSKDGDGEYKRELKVGTENNQRIVAIKPTSDGSEFVLVYVRARDDKDTM
jgi:hypothetical protein